MEHSWCSCWATATARSGVVLLRSEPVSRLLCLCAIGPQAPNGGKTIIVHLSEPCALIFTSVRLPHPDNTRFPIMVHCPFWNSVSQLIWARSLLFSSVTVKTSFLVCLLTVSDYVTELWPTLRSSLGNLMLDSRNCMHRTSWGGGEERRRKELIHLFMRSLSDLLVVTKAKTV